MPDATRIVLHHSESVDGTLVGWLLDVIDGVLGLGPAAMVAVLGGLIVLFPAGLLAFMWYQRRRAARRLTTT